MKFEILTIVLLAVAFLPALFALAKAGPPPGIDVNNAAGTHCGGITRTAEAAITALHLLVKPGTAPATEVLLAAATDEPIGAVADTAAIDEPVGIRLLGGGETMILIGSKAIAAGARVFTTAGGKVTDTAVNNSHLVGRALKACAADGDEVEILTCFPVKQTV